MSKRDQTLRRIAKRQSYCDRCTCQEGLTAHHVQAFADGGADNESNISVLCDTCHKEWHALEHMESNYLDFLETMPSLMWHWMSKRSDTQDMTIAQIKEQWRVTSMQSLWAILSAKPGFIPNPLFARPSAKLGRPRIDPDTETAIRASLESGIGINKTAASLGVGNAVVQRIKAEMTAEESEAA